MKTPEDYKKEIALQHKQERQRLLSVKEIEVYSLSTADQYQRMRYLREDEADRWINEVRRDNALTGKRGCDKSVVLFNRD